MSLMWPTLKPLGFTRNGSFEVQINENTKGMVCIIVHAVDPIEVSFNVGVRFETVEDLTNRLHNISPKDRGWTVGVPLFDLVPETGWKRSSVRLLGNDSDGQAISKVLNDVRALALPFMREWSDLAKLIEHMRRLMVVDRTLQPWVTDPATTLPIALALTGRWKEGRAIVHETVASLPLKKNRGYALTYAKFAEAYEALDVSGLPAA